MRACVRACVRSCGCTWYFRSSGDGLTSDGGTGFRRTRAQASAEPTCTSTCALARH
jgi:hypothetical protein